MMSLSPVRDESGSVLGVASISRPLSSQEDSDARLASLIEAAPDAIVCVDPSGTITLVNDRVENTFGHARTSSWGTDRGAAPPDRTGTHRRQLNEFVGARGRTMAIGLASRVGAETVRRFPWK